MLFFPFIFHFLPLDPQLLPTSTLTLEQEKKRQVLNAQCVNGDYSSPVSAILVVGSICVHHSHNEGEALLLCHQIKGRREDGG